MNVVLSEHLPLLTAAPDGIQKLRGLILELAVRGKLAPQDSDNLPESTFLGAIGKWAIGSGFPVAEQGVQGEEILFAKVGDMNLLENGRFITTTNNTISRATAARLRVNVHPAGTVIFPKIGGAIATNKRRLLIRNTAIDNNCLGLTPNSAIVPDWLFVLLSSIDFTIYQAGTAVPALAQGVLAEIPVRLPSKAEQHRIVAKVDELMALCDRLEAEQTDAEAAHARLVEILLDTLTQSTDAIELATNWQRLAEHFDTLFTTESSLDALKQTILQLAVMGKLVPQDPSDEPASELLKRIAEIRAQLEANGICKKAKTMPPLGENGGPFKLPPNWTWTRFSEIGQFGRGKSKHRPRNDPALFNPGIYPLVQTGEVARADTFVREFHSKYSEIGLSQSKMWPQGTLCITIAANIADSAILGFDACFPDSVVGFVPSPFIGDSRYFLSFMKTTRGELLRFAPSTAQKNINLEILESVRIPLPPKSELTRIVAKVDELMALCDRLKADLVESRSRQARLSATLIESALQTA